MVNWIKHLYPILLTTTLVLLHLVGAVFIMAGSTGAPRHTREVAGYREFPREPIVFSHSNPGAKVVGEPVVSEELYGLQYNQDQNSWTLYAKVLQLRETSVYGRPGEIAQVEYSLEEERSRYAWIVLRIDDYSFSDDVAAPISKGQNIQLHISGPFVSRAGVDWGMCPLSDSYCMNAGFIEGGFPQSEDYDGLTLCPSNTIIRSGFAPSDWINGMLAWRIKIIPNS